MASGDPAGGVTVAMRTLSLADRGLDVVLSGGLRWVERLPDQHGASLLIRGPAGSGKTLCALHVAHALAGQLGGAIAYACVEILPMELEAQLHALRPDWTDVSVHHRNADGVPAGGVQLHARLLEPGDHADAFGAELQRFWDELQQAGVRPKVLVIDSLIRGYGLGSDVSRAFADAVCKLALRWQVALVLLEECAPETPSPWPYAVDTVLELALDVGDVSATMPSTVERRLTVSKHRFGPSDAGPHRFAIETSAGIRVYPRPSAWLEPWVSWGGSTTATRSNATLEMPKGMEWLDRDPKPRVLSVFGPGTSNVRWLVDKLAASDRSTGDCSLDVLFGVPLRQLTQGGPGVWELGVRHPYASANRLMSVMVEAVERLDGEGHALRLVRIGDLSALQVMWDGPGVLRALAVFCELLRQRGIAVVLYETTPVRVTPVNAAAPLFRAEAGHRLPAIANLADAAIESFSGDENTLTQFHALQVTDHRTGKTRTVEAPKT
jgi:KaiC/GvpD/RAD55 family RecA-like ATPase